MSMYKKLIGSLTISLLFLLSATPSFAQQNDVKVTGKITDGSGAPLAGVVVVVKDGKSNNGAVSNTQGVYEIKVPASSTLLFTCLGYTDQEVKLGASNVVNVTMTEDAQSLDEVVVVGYGTQKKKDLTGGLAVVSKQTLEMVSTNNLMDRLVGQVAGLNITTGNEAPGSNQTLLIRGQNSLTASNDPLIILDGIPYSGGLADLDPNIIENMSVLKDASAVAIYGSRGSNGVILIQTKRGSQGEFHVTYKTKLAIAEPMQRIETMGPNEFIRLKQDMGRLKNNYSGEQLDPLVGSIISASEKVNYAKGITNDWQDYVFRTVFTMDHQLSFQGGNEKTTYMASVSYLDNPGVVYNSNYQRTNVYASINQKMNDWLSVGLTTQFVNRETGGATPNLEHAIKQSPYGIYRDETGAYYEEPMDYSNLPNPMKDVNADQKRTGRNFMANGFLDLKLPVKGLSFRSQFGYNYRSQMNGTYYGRNTVTGKKVDGRAELANNHTTDWTWENVLKFDRNFGKHHIDFTGLFSMQEAQYTAASQSGEGFVNDDSSFYRMDGAENKIAISSSFWKENFVSGMFRVNYGFNSKYLLTLTGRADSFSAFAENHKWAFFPSAAVAWHLGEESFIKDNASWIDMLKIRLSYGANGNNAISRYQSLDRLYSTNGVKYIWGDNSDAANSAYLPSDGIGNPDLRWETTYTANLGIDFQFFNGRLGGTIDMYLSNTHDLLMSRTVPIMNGYSKILYNVGQTRNKGIELTLHSQNIRKKDFRWETDFTFSLNRDKIVALRGDGRDDINNKWFIGPAAVGLLRLEHDRHLAGRRRVHVHRQGRQGGGPPDRSHARSRQTGGCRRQRRHRLQRPQGDRQQTAELHDVDGQPFLLQGLLFLVPVQRRLRQVDDGQRGQHLLVYVRFGQLHPRREILDAGDPRRRGRFAGLPGLLQPRLLQEAQLRAAAQHHAGLPCQSEIRPPDRLERHRREFQREQRLRLLQHAPDAELRQHLVRIVPDRPFLRTGINLNLLIKT